jgi:hypothetical protein
MKDEWKKHSKGATWDSKGASHYRLLYPSSLILHPSFRLPVVLFLR